MFYDSAAYGILISVLTLFPVALMATMNVILALLATTSVFMIAVAYLGLLAMTGQSLEVIMSVEGMVHMIKLSKLANHVKILSKSLQSGLVHEHSVKQYGDCTMIT